MTNIKNRHVLFYAFFMRGCFHKKIGRTGQTVVSVFVHTNWVCLGFLSRWSIRSLHILNHAVTYNFIRRLSTSTSSKVHNPNRMDKYTDKLFATVPSFLRSHLLTVTNETSTNLLASFVVSYIYKNNSSFALIDHLPYR